MRPKCSVAKPPIDRPDDVGLGQLEVVEDRLDVLGGQGLQPGEWAAFRESALGQGFESAEAIPLRLREQTIGTLNLLRSESGTLSDDDSTAATAFADVATIGILHERTLRESEVLSQQLQLALNTRIIIEQAKGVVSFTNDVPIEEAFDLIRGYARSHRLPLSDVAARLVRRELHIEKPS